MAPAGVKKDEDKGMGEVVADLWQLCKDYAKQETIDPLKSIGRFLAWGMGGAVALSLGVLFLSLALLRGLQTEVDVFSGGGNWTWVPYAVTLVFTLLVVVLAALAIKRPIRAEEKDVR